MATSLTVSTHSPWENPVLSQEPPETSLLGTDCLAPLTKELKLTDFIHVLPAPHLKEQGEKR